MKTLPDHLELIGADLERAARGLAQKHQRRTRRIQVAALVAATAILGTGVGLAASGVDLLGWVRGADPSEVRFLIDTTEAYDGPAPAALECVSTSGETFVCERSWDGSEIECPTLRKGEYPCGELGASQRVYRLSQRVEPVPVQTREDFLAGVAGAERDGRVTAAQADEFRDAIEGVDDSFFVKWQRVTQVSGFDTFVEGPRGTELVPPVGVPMFVTCLSAERGFRCRDLADAESLPLGAPIYQLEPTDDWRRLAHEDRAAERSAAFEQIWGGPMTKKEARVFLIVLGATAETAGGGGVEVETGAVTESGNP